MQESILVFSDGASKGNPGPGGWGAIVATKDHVVELGGKEAHTTNNRMELVAATEALRKAHALSENAPIVVHTDSAYVIQGIVKWVAGWKRRGWVTQKNEPVLNRELWEDLSAVVEGHAGKIEWEHVGGHVGVVGNERVDEIASGFAEGGEVALYHGPRKEYTRAIEDISHNQQKKEARSKSKSRSRGKAYSYVSAVDGSVVVHQTWAECEARVKGKMARFKKALSKEEEARIIAEFSK